MPKPTTFATAGRPASTRRSALRPLNEHFGELPAKDFGPKKLKKRQAILIEMSWSRRFINKAVNIARRAFKWTANEDLILGAILESLKTVESLKKGQTAVREKPEATAVAGNTASTSSPDNAGTILV